MLNQDAFTESYRKICEEWDQDSWPTFLTFMRNSTCIFALSHDSIWSMSDWITRNLVSWQDCFFVLPVIKGENAHGNFSTLLSEQFATMTSMVFCFLSNVKTSWRSNLIMRIEFECSFFSFSHFLNYCKTNFVAVAKLTKFFACWCALKKKSRSKCKFLVRKLHSVKRINKKNTT